MNCLSVELEHKNLDINSVVFEDDPTSNIEPAANVAGWNLGDFQTSVTEHSYGGEPFSRFVFSVDFQRPALPAARA